MSESDERPRLEINWVQSSGGALAAVSSAVLLSTFGVAGTLIGAAVGSLVITVGGAFYTYSIKATRQRVANAQTVAVARIGLAQARVREASGEMAERRPGAAEEAARDIAEAEVDLDHARTLLEGDLEEADEKPDWRSVLSGLPWKRLALGAVATFVAAMVVIAVFELVTGRGRLLLHRRQRLRPPYLDPGLRRGRRGFPGEAGRPALRDARPGRGPPARGE